MGAGRAEGHMILPLTVNESNLQGKEEEGVRKREREEKDGRDTS